MLEKIRLPSKPSHRGNNWVADGPHCQGCSSHFTFINRKHHCRRCGGLFCNSCTQQRMVLRGQGDSPVRVCEPCKKLEEAARFEMRYGHKNRAGRGGSKSTSKYEEEVLSQILGGEVKDSTSSAGALTVDMVSGAHQTTSSASCSNTREDVALSLNEHNLPVTESTSPEELRQQAIEEKKKYKTLKAEGKSEEALKAFKRGKDLERQAGALELDLRKNRRKALASGKDDSGISGGKTKISPQTSEAKDDLASELRELGWSDMDLQGAEKKPTPLSLESELSTLIGEVSHKINPGTRTHGPDKSEVIAHKKKALELKRAGNLAEAKEELKKAKVLEKHIEEQELLGDAEDSDEEFSSLIRSLDDVKDDDLSFGYNANSTLDFGQLLGAADDLGVDGNFEVTDEDINDPEIAAALKSLGWTEDTNQSEDSYSQPALIDKETLMNEIRSLKKEALNQKRAGNTTEAMTLLKKAKVLEMDLENVSDIGAMDVSNVDEIKDMGRKVEKKSKMMIQKELLSLKKRALMLRRQGKLDEAEDELKRGNILEKQLEEMDKAPNAKQPSLSNKLDYNATVTDLGDEDDVTDQDMQNPTYLSLLENLGWKDDDNKRIELTSSTEVESSSADISDFSAIPAIAKISTGVSRKRKGEIQRELLGLKRKSLALRRKGEVEEAEEVLKMARSLEAQLAEIENPSRKESEGHMNDNENSDSPLGNANFPVLSDSEKRQTEDMGSRDEIASENAIENPSAMVSNSTQENVSREDQSSLTKDILDHKRKAIVLKREGKLAEAKEELRKAKLLEKHLEEKSNPSTPSADVPGSKVSSIERNEDGSMLGQKPLSGRDRFKLQQESLGHKRQALKLRREGRTEEADAELELAKALETQLEEFNKHGSISSSGNVAEQIDNASVEDFLDPELLSALKAIGIQDASTGSQGLVDPVTKPSVVKVESFNEERTYLEERIKTEKVKAVNLKRSGKQAEAMDALRRAKLYEKKLNSFASQ